MIKLDKSRSILVMDIDGTVSDDRHRSHYAVGARRHKQQDLWEEYHARCINDIPHKDMKSLVKGMYSSGDVIIFSTGRPEKWRNHTIDWIYEHLDLHLLEYYLIMRPDDNYLPASDLKPRQIIEHIDDNYKGGFQYNQNLVVVCDDSLSVVKAWNAHKVTTIHVNRYHGGTE